MDRIESFQQSMDQAMRRDLAVGQPGQQEINEHRVAVAAFDQQWSSTATGFNLQRGLAGQAFTMAFMVTISDGTRCAVYADGNHLYTCDECDALQGALTLRGLPSQREAIKMFGSISYRGETHTQETVNSQDRALRKEEELYLRQVMARDSNSK